MFFEAFKSILRFIRKKNLTREIGARAGGQDRRVSVPLTAGLCPLKRLSHIGVLKHRLLKQSGCVGARAGTLGRGQSAAAGGSLGTPGYPPYTLSDGSHIGALKANS
jgi:hypothetical protein